MTPEEKKLDEIHAAVNALHEGQTGFTSSIQALTFGQGEMAKHIADMAQQVRTTNGRVGALETNEAVRVGVEKSNAKMFATVIGVGAILIAASLAGLGIVLG